MNYAQAFENQVIVITGASGNLGRAVADAFAQAGARRVLVGLSQAQLEATFGPSDQGQLLLAADLTQKSAGQAVVAQALAQFGRIDVLCNVAGGFRMGPAVHETPDDDWEFLFALNLRSVLHMVQAVVPGMLAQGAGKIVNVGAFAAARGVAHMGAYTASKSALARVTEAMSGELREQGINVNCVLPTIIDTPENRSAMPDADPARWVDPADLAAAIVFLASPQARAIHGACLPVTGLS
ncbi:SDR family NAD(P)-dependent oxidoreductase [Lampropedia aestuarii]|uniref:SDR family NAD(P)-dependent oxidoreductase n=1 Tax=Lampropedia aestuarii TaxID=2562762 RepID=A0A4V3YX90_9BURK|nr:SDR family NAD(P)-dependent oxidoreductase [Lampropedia aestuarii]THJ34202.1 SDR family NAD(P)-dependent oxidoreductase [Lampropedia aestuarii]